MGLGIGIGINKRKSRGWTPQNIDLDMWVQGREGLDLLNTLGLSPSILPVGISGLGAVTVINACSTGVSPVVNSILIFKGRFIDWAADWVMGAAKSGGGRILVRARASTGKYSCQWGGSTADSTINVDADPHCFIIYDKRLWVMPINTSLTDANIAIIISSETPTASVPLATWPEGADAGDLRYWRTEGSANGKFILYEGWVGTISDNVITWQRKHVATNKTGYIYDTLNADGHATWTGEGVAKVYEENASNYLLDYGYSLYTKDGSPNIYVPYLTTGENPSITVPAGYEKAGSFPADLLYHNLGDSKIRFLADFFDRSDTDIWNDTCRSADDYDSVNTKDFHINNINFKTLIGWLNVGYAGRLFPKVQVNSITDRELLKELILTTDDLTGSLEEKMLKYTGDIAEAVVDESGNTVFDDETNYVVISD